MLKGTAETSQAQTLDACQRFRMESVTVIWAMISLPPPQLPQPEVTPNLGLLYLRILVLGAPTYQASKTQLCH